MGRVAKYKKVKSFDKQHRGGEYVWGSKVIDQKKKKRSKTAEKYHQDKLKRKRRQHNNNSHLEDSGGFDLPPDGKDEFDLKDLKVKKQRIEDFQDRMAADVIPTVSSTSLRPAAKVKDTKVRIGGKTITCTIPKDDAEERRTAKALNINPKSGKTHSDASNSTHVKIEGRREGESMRAFNKRLREQTKLALAHDYKKRSGAIKNKKDDDAGNNNGDDTEGKLDKKERRKEFLKNKKLKKKLGRDYNNIVNDQIQNMNTAPDSDGFITGENAIAATTSSAATTALPSFLEQVEAPPTFNLLPRGAQKISKKSKKDAKKAGMDDEAIKAEQNAMEAMRRKVQAQYSLIKAQRRKEGTFHL